MEVKLNQIKSFQTANRYLVHHLTYIEDGVQTWSSNVMMILKSTFKHFDNLMPGITKSTAPLNWGICCIFKAIVKSIRIYQ